jgi:hypothetical protein
MIEVHALMTEQSAIPSNDSRGRLLGEASGFLVTMGFAMAVRGTREKNRSTIAIGVTVQIAGDLSRGLHILIDAGNYYAAVVLGRQLLEATQLIRYFRAAPARAEFWLTATDADMRKAPDFKPAALRRTTHANDRMYDTHCLLGGHPRSMARLLLPGSLWRKPGDVCSLPRTDGTSVEADLKAFLLTDALQHIYETVLAALEVLDLDALQVLGVLEDNAVERTSELVKNLVAWRDNDPLSSVGSIGT